MNDGTPALPLLEEMSPAPVLGDMAYHRSTILIRIIDQMRAIAVIPPSAARKEQELYNRKRYKHRHCTERAFRWLTDTLPPASAYFLAGLQLAAFVFWG